MDKTDSYKVERPIYSYENLHRDYNEDEITFNLCRSFKQKMKFKNINFQTVMMHILPFPFLMASFYQAKFLIYDFVAGITMLVFHIPQGMAYGLLAGLEPINGLYASFFPPLVYILFGTSRHLSLGTFSIMALLSSVPLLREYQISNVTMMNNSIYTNSSKTLAITDDTKLQISVATTLLAGIFQLSMGFTQLGCIMNYMNDAMIGGFTTASALYVIISQMSQILGYKIKRYSGVGELPYKVYLFAVNIKETQWRTVVITLVCVVILFLFTEYLNPIIKKKLKFPFPIQLLVVILGTVISYFFSFSRKYNVPIVGNIPKGLPYPMIPDISIWPRVFVDALILGIVGFVMNSALVKVYCLKFNYEADYNQELVAYGLSNIVGSFFFCTMSAGALARSAVVVQVGMKSQVATIISCVLMLFVLLFIGPLFESVPTSVLSSIIVVSLKSMLMQITEVPGLYKLSKFDFDVWMVSFLATVFLNVPYGLVAGFLFSLLTIIIRLQNPQSQLLGRLPGTDLYRNMKIFKSAVEIPGIKIFRYDAPVYFANAEHFQTKLYKKTGLDPRRIKPLKKELTVEKNINQINSAEATTDETTQLRIHENNTKVDFVEEENNSVPSVEISDTKSIVIDLSSVNYVDNVAIRILEEIYSSYRKLGIQLFLAGPNHRIRKMLTKSKFAEDNLSRIMYVTIHDAILSILLIGKLHL